MSDVSTVFFERLYLQIESLSGLVVNIVCRLRAVYKIYCKMQNLKKLLKIQTMSLVCDLDLTTASA